MAASPPKPPSSAATTKRKRKSPATTITTKRRRRSRLEPTLSPIIPAISAALSAAQSFLTTNDPHLRPSHFLSLDSSLSSAAVSLSKIQSLLGIKKPQIPFSVSSQPSCWFEHFLTSTDENDLRWVETFRMSKPTFLILNSVVSHSLPSSISSISPNFALGAAIYRLAHSGSFSSVGKKFGLSSKDACRAFYAVCKVICEKLGDCFGELGSEMAETKMGFGQISLPNCYGVLGIGKFHVEGEVLGKDGFLMAQALVDSNGRFLDVSAGWPSTLKPGLILRQTRVFLGVEESKELLNGFSLELSDGNLLPQYILGDSCYPLMPWLITPVAKRGEEEGELSLEERKFNEVHKKAMGFVRLAFRRVRANWQLLNRKWKEKMVEFFPFVIMAACLLNTILMKQGERLLDEEPGGIEEQELPVYDGEVSEGAGRSRDILVAHLSQGREQL